MKENEGELFSEYFKSLGFDFFKVIAITISFFYGSGYLIQAITLRNYGIYRLETVKLQYIEIGVTFTVLFLLLTALPIGVFLAHFRIRKKSPLPNYRLGGTGYFINTSNLFLVVMFASLFLTQQEWSSVILKLEHPKIELRIYEAFAIYVPVALFVLVVMPLVERLVVKKASNPKILYRFLIEPLRFSAVVLGIVIDFLLLRTFPWLLSLVLNGVTFLGTAILLAGAVFAIIYYMMKLADKRSFYLLAVAGTIGIFLVMYMCINAYVWAIIRHIPMNRGGKLPVTRTYLVTNNSVLEKLPIERKVKGEITILGPVYVLEETQYYLHVTEEVTGTWHRDWVPTYAIKKDAIQYLKNERITKGGPRDHK